jgi:hypothetical protein
VGGALPHATLNIWNWFFIESANVAGNLRSRHSQTGDVF